MSRLAAALAAFSLVAASDAGAQMVVHDPGNYAQNLLQAARALETINNQVTSLQNEAQLLTGQARNLTALPFSSLQALQGQVRRTQQLLGQAERLAFDVGRIDTAFSAGAYGPVASAAQAALVARAQSRWEDEAAALRDALRIQAGVVQGTGEAGQAMGDLVAASQAADGALSAAQAGNQLLALQSRQLADLTAMMAAQGRAEALAGAARAASRAEARARFDRFMSAGRARP